MQKAKSNRPSTPQIQAIKDRIRKQKEAEEEQRKLEVEKKKLEEEQRKKEEDESIKHKEKLIERQRRRDDLRREGKILSSKQRARQERDQAFVSYVRTIDTVRTKTEVPTTDTKSSSSNAEILAADLNSPCVTEDHITIQNIQQREDEMNCWDYDDTTEEHKTRVEEIQILRVRLQQQQQQQKPSVTVSFDGAKAQNRIRAPICCVLGHVDTGKTSLLDSVRNTHVQKGEVGGITQQMGCTNLTREHIDACIRRVDSTFSLQLPGILVVDTPGHESFANMRVRGSSLCDLAIVVVDIMVGLERQTLECLQLLKQKKIPFVVALNKIDRCHGWNEHPDKSIRAVLDTQLPDTISHFNTLAAQVSLQLSSQGINNRFVYSDADDTTDVRTHVTIIPTSAKTGQGIPDFLKAVSYLTQTLMKCQLTTTVQDKTRCVILEVKNTDGFGTTIDTILATGSIAVGDKIVVGGRHGPITTQVRALLSPPAQRELRVMKHNFTLHKRVFASVGIRVSAPQLESALPGSTLHVYSTNEEHAENVRSLQDELSGIQSHASLDGIGIGVHASTIGSLDAILVFLRDVAIPVSHISIHGVTKKDVIRTHTMQQRGLPEHSVIIAFDVDIDIEAQITAKQLGVSLFKADIIYHLFDELHKHKDTIQRKKKEDAIRVAVFPVELTILPDHVYNTKNPIIVGCRVCSGTLRRGTPLVTSTKHSFCVGVVSGIQKNNKDVDMASVGEEICVKISAPPSGDTVVFGRHVLETDMLLSQLSRDSIASLSRFFMDELGEADRELLTRLCKSFGL